MAAAPTTTTTPPTAQEEQKPAQLSPADYVELGDFAGLQKLIEQGVSVDTPGLGGDTALHIAAHKCLLNAAEFLLQKGSNPNKQNDNGSTPMHKLAASPLARKRELFGRVLKLATLLIANGADATLPNREGMLSVSLVPPYNEGLRELLAKQCHKETVLTPERHLSRVIGSGGKNLQGFMKKHGVLINVMREAQTDAGVPVVILGKKDQAEACARAIQELVRKHEETWEKEQAVIKQQKEEALALARRRAEDDTIVDLPLSKKQQQKVTVGDTVKEIEKKFDVAIIIHANATEQESGLTIKGKQDGVYAASQYITEEVITRPLSSSRSPSPPMSPHSQQHGHYTRGGYSRAPQDRQSPRNGGDRSAAPAHHIKIQRPGAGAASGVTTNPAKGEKFVPAPRNIMHFEYGSIRDERRRARREQEQQQQHQEEDSSVSNQEGGAISSPKEPIASPKSPAAASSSPSSAHPTQADFPSALSPILAEMFPMPAGVSPAAAPMPASQVPASSTK